MSEKDFWPFAYRAGGPNKQDLNAIMEYASLFSDYEETRLSNSHGVNYKETQKQRALSAKCASLDDNGCKPITCFPLPSDEKKRAACFPLPSDSDKNPILSIPLSTDEDKQPGCFPLPDNSDKKSAGIFSFSNDKETQKSINDTMLASKNKTTGDEINGKYEDASYHHKNSKNTKSQAPKNGQEALNNSELVKEKGNTNYQRRIGISEGEFVILDETGNRVFHGHVRDWNELTREMKDILIQKQLVTKKGRIL